MKVTTTAPAPVPLVAQLAAAEAQARDFRRRRAELQQDLADLRDLRQAEMRNALATGGDSPALKAIRTKIAEHEVLIEEADNLILDADQLAQDLHAQLAAVRSEEEKARITAEVARLSPIAETRIRELNGALEGAIAAAGATVIALAELFALDKVAANRLTSEARQLDPRMALLQRGWKIPGTALGDPFEWHVHALLPPLAGLDPSQGVTVRDYLAARDAATHAASGAEQ